MAYLTTFEAETSPVTIDDLFKVNDYFGVKLFGNYWPQIKQAAAQIAQKAVDAPIMFYVRSFANENQPAGQSSTLGRALWGYNDRAGVELLGAATWGAVKNEMDELLGWNPFSTIKKVASAVTKPIESVASAAVNWAAGSGVPGLTQAGKVGKVIGSAWETAKEMSPITTGERLVSYAQGDRGYTAEEIEAAARQKAAKEAAYKSAYESGKKAGLAASAAAKAAAAAEAAAAKAAGDVVTAVTPEGMSDTTKKVLLVGGLGLGAYLLLRRRGGRR